MSMITASSGGQTQIVGQRSHSDGSNRASAGASLMPCQPAHAHAERQVLCDGFGALAILFDANVEDGADPRRGTPATRIMHIVGESRVHRPIQSSADRTVPGSDPVPRPVIEAAVRPQRPLDAACDARCHTAKADTDLRHPVHDDTASLAAEPCPAPGSRRRRGYWTCQSTTPCRATRSTFPRGQLVTRLPRPCRQAQFRQVDACLS